MRINKGRIKTTSSVVSVGMKHRSSVVAPGMKVGEFLELIPEKVKETLPPELRDFQVKGPFASLMKLYYQGGGEVHYEVWVQRKASLVEVGLHLESDPETNKEGLMTLAKHFLEIRRALGPRPEAEQWTKSWTRLHETLPLESLTTDYLERVAQRLALYIKVLQPILKEEVIVRGRPCGGL